MQSLRTRPNPMVAVSLLLALAACTADARSIDGPSTDALTAGPPAAPEVETVAAVAVDAPQQGRTLSIDTTLFVDHDVILNARMSGTIEEILADRGARVRKDQPLLRLRNTDLLLLLQRAEVEARLKKSDFERARKLFAEHALSASDFEQKQLASEAAELDVGIAREDLERSYVRAPFDGLIIDRLARLGQKLTEDANTPLFRLTASAPLEARLFLPEESARSLRTGDRVEVVSRHGPEVSVAGRIQWLSPVVDAASGTALAIVAVPQGSKADSGLYPGAAVTVRLSVTGGGTAVLVPALAVNAGAGRGPGARGLIRVMETDGPAWRDVRMGETRGESIEIVEGLRPGEMVVVSVPRRD